MADLIAPDELMTMLDSPEFGGLPAYERAAMLDAGLNESRAWVQSNDEKLLPAFDETAAALAAQFRPAAADIELSRQSPAMTVVNQVRNVGPGLVGGLMSGGGRVLDAGAALVEQGLTAAFGDNAMTRRGGFFAKTADVGDALQQAGQELRPVSPTNPISSAIGSGLQQGLGLVATMGAAAPVLGTRAAVTTVPLVQGAVMGGGQGVQVARDLGITSPAGQLATGAGFALAEVAAERLGGVGSGAALTSGLRNAVRTTLSETVEEPLTGAAQEGITRLAGSAVEDPNRPGFTITGQALPTMQGFAQRRALEAVGGAAGGTVFGGLQLLAGAGGQDTTRPAPVLPRTAGAITPLGDIAAGTFVPEPAPAGVGQTMSDTRPRLAPILSNVPDGARRMPAFRDNPLAASTPSAGGNVLRDFGIARSPQAEQVANAAEVERQKQVAAMQVQDGKRAMPTIPDSPLGIRDVLDYLNETPLRLARKGTEQAGNAENDWSERFNVPMYYRKFIASSERGYEPSTVADQLYKENVIKEPTVDALMEEVQKAINARTQYRVQFRQRDKALKQEAQQVSSFERDQAKAGDRDKTLVALDDVAPGDEMLINGEKAVVRKIDYDQDGYLTNVVIEDGKRYGVLSLDPTTRAGVFVDEYQPRPREQTAPDFEDPFAMQSVTAEELAAEKQRAKERAVIAERQNASLKGDAGEYGTPDMLDSTAGDMALFNQSSPASVTQGPERAAANQTGEQAIGAGSSPATGAENMLADNRTESATSASNARVLTPAEAPGLAAVQSGGVDVPTEDIDPIAEDLARAQADADQAGPGWAEQVDLSEPVGVYRGADGRLKLYDGHHRWLAAKMRGVSVRVKVAAAAQQQRNESPALAVLETLNADLPEAARAKWTPEVYAKARRYFQSGKDADLDGLSTIQKRRVIQAKLDSNPVARAEQDRAERKAEQKLRTQEKKDASFEQKTTFKNLIVDRDLEAGFISDAGVSALFDLANDALRAGRNFAQWSAGMIKRFGEAIRQYLAHVWAVAKDNLPTNAAQNVRMGSAAKTMPVRMSQSGAVINLMPSLKGGTKVFHAKGEPFRVNYLGMRELLTGSPLPAELVPVLTRTNQEKKALEQRAAQLGRDLQTAINAYVSQSRLSPVKVNEQVAAMMSGDAQADALLSAAAPVLHARTRAVRVLLDNLSAAVAQTLPTGDLRNTIMDNLGSWLRRSYAAFDPASGWNYDALLRAAAAGTQVNGKDAKTLLDNARKYLRTQNPQATPKEIEADLRDLMDRNVWERELTGGGAKKSTSSLMRRKEIAPEIRAVMGEEQNPVKLLTSSAGFQAQFIARHHGQVAMREAGLAAGLFAKQRGGVYTEQMPVNDRAWSGFAGVWTTPQLAKALENASGVIKEGSDLGGLIVSTLKTLGNKAKLNRVALNPDSWMVNMLGNLTALVQNGDVFAWSILNRVQKAREITGAGDAKTGAVVDAAAEALQDASRDMQARLTEAGVLGSSLTLADIEASLPRHLLQWLALDQKADKAAGALEGVIVGQAMGRGLGAPGRVIGGVIGGVAGAAAGGTKIQAWQQRVADFLMTKPDALARVTGWMTNYETALASGMAPEVAATWANERTLNTFPNYAALPGVLREASKLGIMGSFIAFQHEVYRNFGWNVRYAMQELASGNAAMMQRGLQRLAGIGAIAGMAGGGLAALLAATGAAGTDDERNKLYRKWFGAPWEKDAVLAFREFDAEKVSYFNTSYLLPQTTIAELLQAMREGETPEAAAARVVDRLYEQFVGSSVHLGPLLSAAMNQKRSGAPLTYQTGVAGVAERLDEPLKTILEPGFAEKMERLTYALRAAERNGTLFSVEQEFRRLIGLREQTRTWPRLIEQVYRDLAKENMAIRMQANRELGLNRPGAATRAVTEANAKLDALRQKVADFERDAMKLGVPDYTLSKIKREASVGRIPRVVLQADGKRVGSVGG